MNNLTNAERVWEYFNEWVGKGVNPKNAIICTYPSHIQMVYIHPKYKWQSVTDPFCIKLAADGIGTMPMEMFVRILKLDEYIPEEEILTTRDMPNSHQGF